MCFGPPVRLPMLSTPPRGDAVSVDYGIKLMNLPTRTFTLLFQYTYNRTRSALRVDSPHESTHSCSCCALRLGEPCDMSARCPMRHVSSRPDLASGEAVTSLVTGRRTHQASSATNFPLNDLESRATEPLPSRPCVGRSSDFRGYRAADALVNVCGNLPA